MEVKIYFVIILEMIILARKSFTMIRDFLPQLHIELAIVHIVPRHKKADSESTVTYSQHESDINEELKLFFKKKIIESINGERALNICFEDDSESVAPGLVKKLIINPLEQFVDITQKITKQMFDVQTGLNPGGLLVFFLINVKTKKAIVIFKVEADTGAQLRMNMATKSIDIVQVKDIMFTEKTKLYKAALFFDRVDFSSHFDGIMMDHQVVNMDRIYAHFFMHDFLGCVPLDDPRLATKAFFEATKEFISTLEDPVKKAKYLLDINSYIQRNEGTFSPKDFAEGYLGTPTERDNFKEFIIKKNIPFTTHPKDLHFIKTHFNKVVIGFENGIDIIIKEGDIGSKMTLVPVQDGKYKAEIISKIRKVK